MPERRYSDGEIAEIFARATEAQHAITRQLPSRDGLTLGELQAIGREAGIPAELVSQAAKVLDQPPPPPTPAVLGIPIGVAHTVELGRTLADDEWDRFVVRLRDTFDAKGTISIQGAFRSWSNGNLHVMLEPGANGHRVRFRTRKGDTQGLLSAGIAMTAVSALIVFTTWLRGATDVTAYASSGTVGLIGVALATSGLLRLPRWLRTRRGQMERLGAELLAGDDRPAQLPE